MRPVTRLSRYVETVPTIHSPFFSNFARDRDIMFVGLAVQLLSFDLQMPKRTYETREVWRMPIGEVMRG